MRRLLELLIVLWRRTAADRVSGLAAEAAFFVLLSFFPGLMVLAAALGWLDVVSGKMIAGRAEAAVIQFLQDLLTDRAAGLVRTVRNLFAQQRPGVLTTALAFALWSLSRAFVAVIEALNEAYGVAERRTRLGLEVTALGLSIGGTILAALVLSMIVVGPLLGHGHDVARAVGLGGAFGFAWRWLRWPVAFALAVLWTTTLYHLAPARRAPWRRDLPGAIAAALLWLLMSGGLRVYLEFTGRMNQVLGLLGGGVILMSWVYLLCLALMLGGELNAVLLERAGIERRPRRSA